LRRFAANRTRCLALAGALLGLASGLKWTFFVYAVGATLALIVLWPRLRLDRKSFLWFGVGGMLGYLPFGGYWNWVLWSNYGNLFFPYWNRYFQSSYGLQSNYRDLRFLPDSLAEAVTYPFRWFLGIPTVEESFRDARYALLFVLIAIVLAAALGRAVGKRIARRWFQPAAECDDRDASSHLARPEPTLFLLAFFLFSFALWMYLFAIQRYLSPLGLISGLMLLLALDCVPSRALGWVLPARPARLAAFVALAFFSLFWMQGNFSSWRVPYGTGWFGLGVPAELKQPNSLLILLGGEPTSFVIAYLPQTVRVVRLVDSTVPLDGAETALSRRAEEIISRHTGPIRTLAAEPLRDSDLAYLKRFGLTLQPACVEFRSDTDRLTTCALKLEPDP
jgi:hypothetical protein